MTRTIKQTPTALELCSGIGGASLGIHAAGFTSKGVDVSAKAVDVARNNGLDHHVLDLFDGEALHTLRQLDQHPDLVWASPSCKGFSLCSGATPEHKAMQNSLTTRVSQLIVELAPPTFIIENVLSARKNPTFREAIDRLNKQYHTAEVYLDACRMGVPQTRKRVFIVGVRTNGQDLAAAHLLKDFVEQCRKSMREGAVTTMEEAIPELRGKTLFSFPRRKDSQSVFACSRPSPTVRSMVISSPVPSLLEVKQNAGPISEAIVADKKLALRLNGFPDGFQLGEQKVASAVQLGNVVVPAQAQLVATFARDLIPLAGNGSQPGIHTAAKYALAPVRFTNKD
jgi:hypothetical protein